MWWSERYTVRTADKGGCDGWKTNRVGQPVERSSGQESGIGDSLRVGGARRLQARGVGPERFVHAGGSVVRRTAAACTGGGVVDPGTEGAGPTFFPDRRVATVHGRICGGKPGCAALAQSAVRKRRGGKSRDPDEPAPRGSRARTAASVAAIAAACFAGGPQRTGVERDTEQNDFGCGHASAAHAVGVWRRTAGSTEGHFCENRRNYRSGSGGF